jgi:hypothetical protein
MVFRLRTLSNNDEKKISILQMFQRKKIKLAQLERLFTLLRDFLTSASLMPNIVATRAVKRSCHCMALTGA